MKTLDRGDAPPFDAAAFARDAVIPSDQKIALDRAPGWSLGDAATVRRTTRALARWREDAKTRRRVATTLDARGTRRGTPRTTLVDARDA